MAKENLVLLHGRVKETPRIFRLQDGTLTKGMFTLEVVRRPRSSAGNYSQGHRFDCPVIMTRDPKFMTRSLGQPIAGAISDLKQGDLCDVRGVLSTREIIKSSICPCCGHKNEKEGNIVYVTPLYICRRETDLPEEEAKELLKMRNEVSNICMVIGTLCREVMHYKDEKKRAYAEYQLAVNRKYRVKEDPENVKTDYPWVKAFGKQALKDVECLSVNSVVYINGALQTRPVNRTTICEHCGEAYQWEDKVATEIVPYSTEYLANCKVPQAEEDGLDSDFESPLDLEEDYEENQSIT